MTKVLVAVPPAVHGAGRAGRGGVFVAAVAIACLKLYDEPARRWLIGRFLGGPRLRASSWSS